MSIELAALFFARNSPISSTSFGFPNVKIESREKAEVNQSGGKLYLVIMRYLCERRYTNKYSVNGIIE